MSVSNPLWKRNPGRAPATAIETQLPPADCQCTWSFHGRSIKEGGFFRLKNLTPACPVHHAVATDAELFVA